MFTLTTQARQMTLSETPRHPVPKPTYKLRPKRKGKPATFIQKLAVAIEAAGGKVKARKAKPAPPMPEPTEAEIRKAAAENYRAYQRRPWGATKPCDAVIARRFHEVEATAEIF